MKKNLGFRAWFYFRQGWSTYFAFILAAINTMVTTYYLAIKNIPDLQGVFPSFVNYIAVFSAIGIPVLILIGYVHYKRTQAFAAEAEIGAESNPYLFKLYPGYQPSVLFPFHLILLKSLVKLSNNEKLTDNEINQIKQLQTSMEFLIKGGSINKK